MARAPRPLPLGTKRRFLTAAHQALGATPACGLYVRAARARGAAILMYHSVAPVERTALQDPAMAMPVSTFAAQMSFLARRRTVISLDALTDMLIRGASAEPGTVVITFDDGYLDNYEIAAPILAQYGLQATVFLATGYIERAENMWIDVLFASFKGRTRQRLELAEAEFDLNDPSQLDQGYASTASALAGAGRHERAALMASIREQLQPAHDELRLVMSWAEVRALCERYPNISIGSHTREHVDLSRMPCDEVVEELTAAHADIRRELGRDVLHFSFPYGRGSAHARLWLRSQGYHSAALTEPMSLVQSTSNPFALTRVEAPTYPSLAGFAYYTSGAHPSLSRRLFLGAS